MATYTFSICSECAGRGLVAAGEHGSISYPRCGGAGIGLRNEQNTLYQFSVPLYIRPASASEALIRRVTRYTLAGGVLFLFLGTTLYDVTAEQSLTSFFWNRGILHVLMGISGLASMYALTQFQHHQTSLHSLDTLPQQSESPVNLLEYSNPRLLALLHAAAQTARERHCEEVTDDILLVTLLNQPRIQTILSRLELPLDEMLTTVDALVAPGHNTSVSRAILSQKVRERLCQAFIISEASHFPYIDIEDILLAYTKDPAEHASFFTQYGITTDALYAVSRWYAEDQDRSRHWAFWRERGRSRPQGYMNRAWTALPTPLLDSYSEDITRSVGLGEISPALAHKAQIDRTLEILASPAQNSAILLGEPGVGKSTILNGIAVRMIEESVPEVLKDKRLVKLDAVRLLNADSDGTIMQAVLDEVIQAGNVILAIPNLQVLAASGDAMNAATLLANALNAGQIHVISSATYADYHRYIEQNPNLSTQVSIIEIPPANTEQTLQILEEETPSIEAKFNVYLTLHALREAVTLAEQYIPDIAAPSGALALIGDAASAVQQSGKRWVRKEDVQHAIEKRTNIPIRTATGSERDTFLNLEAELHKRVIGQNQAITSIATALRRSRAGLTNKSRPMASFLFVGPTGVGKTETAKAVANLIFGEKGHFIRLDMSEYQDPTSVYRLIGAPSDAPGQRTEGGELTQAVREHPYSLILLDELEKADSHVLDIFLQLLDDGRLTENTGRTIHFQNCLVVATSNAGSAEIMKLINEGITPENLPKQILSLLQRAFKPEFLNRFDAIVPFQQLTRDEILQVVHLMLQEVITKTATQGLTITFEDAAVQRIAELGYDPLFGARPLRRVIQDKVEGMLATKLLENTLNRSETLQITAEMIQ